MDLQSRCNYLEHAAHILNDRGYSTSYQSNYSGRGMYGRSTPAISCDSDAPVHAAIVEALVTSSGIGHEEMLDILYELFPLKTDSLGFQVIYY